MSKKILVILGHPQKQSLCGALAQSYVDGAKSSSADIKELYIGDLKFEPILRDVYGNAQEMEGDLKKAQEDIKWADHLVFVYPTWWGSMPALMKGFIEKVFLPGFAFKENGNFYEGCLGNRSAHLIVTMDSPTWFYKFVTKSPGHTLMKKAILEFCGIKPVRISDFGPVKNSTKETREKWLAEIRRKGERLL